MLTHEAPLPGGSGFWAEHVLVDAAHVSPCPAGLDAVVAGALPVPGLTARQALDRLGVRAHTRLLITGGSGTTGTLHLAARPVDLTDAPGIARLPASGQAAGTTYTVTP